jgi:hypothetical protein
MKHWLAKSLLVVWGAIALVMSVVAHMFVQITNSQELLWPLLAIFWLPLVILPIALKILHVQNRIIAHARTEYQRR